MAHEDRAFYDVLADRGVTRRDFLKFCGSVAAMLGLSETMVPTIAAAVEEAASSKLYPAVWVNGGACTGCTESVAQSTNPDVATIVLDILSMNYMETIMMATGESANEALRSTAEQNEGKFVLIYEGSVMTGVEGNTLRVEGRTSLEILDEVGPKAAAVIAVGSCAVDGGWVRSVPSVKAKNYPTGVDEWATGVSQYFAKKNIATPVVNLPTCPVNPEWVVAMVIDTVILGGIDAEGKVTPEFVSKLDEFGRPKLIFGQTVHDNCPRRGHFENGEFVYEFGSAEEAKGYCLYPVGCKGPQTYTNCPVVRWNNQSSWCVESGSPCIGCGDFNWVDQNAPFLSRFRQVGIGSTNWNPATVGAAAGGLVVGALAVHGVGMKAAGRIGEGPATEDMKDYDRKRTAKGGDK
ncbi:MAG TPA: hydrogenase small subunit [Coriobacteriia bacterium]|nr:hydrogenase small subunit [Coriobacteriia bacterium]